jgi:hypothetical protein
VSAPYSGTTDGASHFFDLSCMDENDYYVYDSNYYYNADEAAPELVFSIDVPVGYEITFQQTNTTASYDTVYELRLGGSCPGETYVACGSSLTPDTWSLSWMNRQDTTETVYYIQSGLNGASGDFTLEWSLSGEP